MKARGVYQALAGVLALLAPAVAQAQKSLGDAFKDPENGFQFRVPTKWRQIPLQPNEKHLIARFVGPQVSVNLGKEGSNFFDEPELRILKIVPKAAPASGNPADAEEPEESDDPKKPPSPEDLKKRLEEIEARNLPHSFEEWVRKFSGSSGVRFSGQPKTGKLAKQDFTEYDYFSKTGRTIDFHHYAAVFRLEGSQIALDFRLNDSPNGFPKWEGFFRECARSFKALEVKKPLALSPKAKPEPPPGADPERRRHEADVAKTPGWALSETKHYFLKARQEEESFVEEAKDLLEAIRARLEEDFPPLKPITEKQVIRVCHDRFEFANYDGPNNARVFWNPKAKEILVTASDDRVGRPSIIGSLYREACRQYLFFRCGELKFHPWFDRGTADYYGGGREKYGKIEIHPNGLVQLDRHGDTIPGRLETIRAMIREGKTYPLDSFIRMNLEEFSADREGKLAQGWSLIYFLREGARAPGWKKEWANIASAYLRVLVDTKDPNRAVEEAFKGIDLPALQEAWMQFIRNL